MYNDISNNCTNMIPEEQESTTRFVQNISCNFFDIANAAGKFAKNPRSKTALQFFFEKLKGLEKEWYEFGVKFEQMQRQNENLMHECERERNKSKVYQKRLKFVKDNQEHFERLREVYLNTKHLETPDTCDNECQTVQTDSDTTISVERDTITSAKNALSQIKNLVNVRENRYEDNLKKIVKLKENISVLEAQNTKLTEILASNYKKEKPSAVQNDVGTSGSAKIEVLHVKNNNVPVENIISKNGTNGREVESERKKADDKQNAKQTVKRQLNSVNVPVVKAHKQLNNKIRVEVTTENSETNIPLKTIKSIRTKLATSLGLIPSATTTVNELISLKARGGKSMNKGDCKEVEILKRIQVEIEKRQTSIKEKIDRYNLLIDK